MPSSRAARVEDTASSMRCLRSLASTSVAAPTLITPTPPASFARRSLSFSRSHSESTASISRRSCCTRSSTASLLPPPSTIVVVFLVTVTRRAEPVSSRVAWARSIPSSGVITMLPVRMARSCIIALRRSPNPGALSATTSRVPRSLFTTRVDSASPSTSSAIMVSGFFACTTFSSRGIISATVEILPW